MNVKTEVKEIPLLMKGEMVRASLADLKTQTRRTRGLQEINEFPDEWKFLSHNNGLYVFMHSDGTWVAIKCPYGRKGDHLWVRESFIDGIAVGGYAPDVDPDKEPDGATIDIIYKADGEQSVTAWKPSIHMPRWACRLILENVVDPIPQRLQEISHEDAIAEGAEYMPAANLREQRLSVSQIVFAGYWDSVNGKKYPRGNWENNNWVWKIDYKRLIN